MWIRAAARADVGVLGGVDQALYRLHGTNMNRTRFSGPTDDVRERRKTFDTMLESCDGWLDDLSALHELAMRALSRESLERALDAYARGVTNSELVDELVTLALDLYGEARELPEWRVLAKCRSLGPRRARMYPPLVLDELVRDVRARIEWRRVRWCGL
jgi:hypothetical protein